MTAGLVEAKEMVEDSLVADPDGVAAAVDGPALRSITARRRAADIISKLMTKARVVTMDGMACALKIYAPQANFTERTEEETKAIRAARKEMETRRRRCWLQTEYAHRRVSEYGRGWARGGGRRRRGAYCLKNCKALCNYFLDF